MLPLRSLIACAVVASACAATDEATRAAHYGDDVVVAPAPDVVTVVDASTPADVPVVPFDLPPPRFDPDASCTTDAQWKRGDRGRSLMNPGGACLACHTREREDTGITLGGTLYYAPHEEDLCLGYTGDPPGSNRGAARVRIVDATGYEVTLPANASGNFSSTAAFRFPLRVAEVIGPTGEVNAMSAEVPHGDCNACHTRAGTTTPTGEAPGRILVPF